MGHPVSSGVCSQSLKRERSFGEFTKKSILALKEIPTNKLNKPKGLEPFIRLFLAATFVNGKLPFCFDDLHSQSNVMCGFCQNQNHSILSGISVKIVFESKNAENYLEFRPSLRITYVL